VSPSSNNLAAGLYFGRDSVSCVLLRADAGERTVVSSGTINLPLPLFKGAPQEKTTRALVDALVACSADVRGRHMPVHVVVPDAAFSIAAFDLEQVPAGQGTLERLVEFRLAKELGSSAGACVSQLLGSSEGKTLLLGASMDKAWLASLLSACGAAGIVPWSLSPITAAIFNGFHDSVQGASGAMITMTADAWSLWAWDVAGLARPLRSQWRLGLSDEREIAADVERALIAYTDGHAAREIGQLRLWNPGANGALGDALDQRAQKPCDRRVWPETFAIAESCAASAALAACVMAAATA